MHFLIKHNEHEIYITPSNEYAFAIKPECYFKTLEQAQKVLDTSSLRVYDTKNFIIIGD